jgi:hypothetical protein
MTRTLCLLYVLASGLALHASLTSAQHGAYGYALGFTALDLLLLLAAIREYLALEERRGAAARAERDARRDAEADAEAIDGIARIELAAACCETWWTSAGADHDTTCQRDRRTA